MGLGVACMLGARRPAGPQHLGQGDGSGVTANSCREAIAMSMTHCASLAAEGRRYAFRSVACSAGATRTVWALGSCCAAYEGYGAGVTYCAGEIRRTKGPDSWIQAKRFRPPFHWAKEFEGRSLPSELRLITMAALPAPDAGPFMIRRRLSYVEDAYLDADGAVGGRLAPQDVWSFNLKAVPRSMEDFHLHHPSVTDPETIKQVRRLIDWHNMPPWQQLESGGVTLRPWTLPSYLPARPSDCPDWLRLEGMAPWVALLEADVKLWASLCSIDSSLISAKSPEGGPRPRREGPAS
jgi:hypothetical protein